MRAYAAPILLKRQPCRLGPIVREAWTRVVGLRPEKPARLGDLPPEPAVVCEVDRFFMERVFGNIFENALDSPQERVEIDIRWAAAELEGQPGLCIRLHDNGPAMSVEQQQRIFEPFYTSKAQGHGLGMAVARRIVEAHGGNMTAVPGLDRGTDIVINLPGANQ